MPKVPVTKETRILFSSQALSGDEDATKVYCGSYYLIGDDSGKLYRCDKDVIPDGYHFIDAQDSDGFLPEQYWSLPRV